MRKGCVLKVTRGSGGEMRRKGTGQDEGEGKLVERREEKERIAREIRIKMNV